QKFRWIYLSFQASISSKAFLQRFDYPFTLQRLVELYLYKTALTFRSFIPILILCSQSLSYSQDFTPFLSTIFYTQSICFSLFTFFFSYSSTKIMPKSPPWSLLAKILE
ncbi:hypothetical protein Pfo_031218, partial [Paulownia fortunei]